MLVLLPPSEGKAAGGSGAPLELERLSLPGLTAARRSVLDELEALCAHSPERARTVLGLSEGQRGEVEKNAALRTSGTRPAAELYTGVLYDALGLTTLEPEARERAERTLLVFSGLWGALLVGDQIPSYRCSMGVKLPATGSLGAHWRAPMAEVLPRLAGEGPVLDLRSAAYAAAWKPRGGLAERTVTLRVLHSKTVGGVEKRSVVSHFNKATKGRLLRDLLVAGVRPADPEQLLRNLRELGHMIEAQPPEKAGAPWRADVVVTAL
ncbi:peroxide stress protein YaaA [Streptomyces sp. TP-A0874]|uniref:peroxide stress protein YaaA n=1 Tax=Streptomyces sp. TP-A0874 TaxID=549819 RepID=UPI0008537E90|nr:peroxide stress protein YaaA [Streptomyces sp. TP-A0874]